MEIVGGFMVMMSIIGLFLAVVWLIMPFVVFAVKGKQDRTLEMLEGIDKRLAALESHLQRLEPFGGSDEPLAPAPSSSDSVDARQAGNGSSLPETAA